MPSSAGIRAGFLSLGIRHHRGGAAGVLPRVAEQKAPFKGFLHGAGVLHRKAVHRRAGVEVVGPQPHGPQIARHRAGRLQPHSPGGHLHGVVVHPAGFGQVLAAGQPRRRHTLRVRKDFLGGAGAQGAPLVHDAQGAAQAVGFVPAVGHQHRLPPHGAQQVPKLGLQLVPQMGVQGRERFIQQQKLGVGGQHPGQGHPLGLPARKLGRAQGFQPLQLQLGQHLPHNGVLLGPGTPAAGAAADVFVYRHGGEQGVLLEQVPHPPLLGRQVDARFGIKEHPSIQQDAPPVGALDARNALQGQAFAAAGSPQQPGDGRVGIQPGPQPEAAQVFFYVYKQAHGVGPPFAGRSSQFTVSSTAAEMPRFTPTQNRAPASSPVRHSWYTVVEMVAVRPGV